VTTEHKETLEEQSRAITIPIEAVQKDLKRLFDESPLGETVTLVGSDGAPQALLISLKATGERPQSVSDWDVRWDALAQKN
jgi:hypothetical protein